MLLFITLIVIDSGILLDTCIGVSISDSGSFLPNYENLPKIRADGGRDEAANRAGQREPFDPMQVISNYMDTPKGV